MVAPELVSISTQPSVRNTQSPSIIWPYRPELCQAATSRRCGYDDALTRAACQAFRDVAANAGSRWLQVEVVCSDVETHRRRAETRIITVEGLTPPDWDQIQKRHFSPWSPDLRVDTSVLSVEESVETIMKSL